MKVPKVYLLAMTPADVPFFANFTNSSADSVGQYAEAYSPVTSITSNIDGRLSVFIAGAGAAGLEMHTPSPTFVAFHVRLTPNAEPTALARDGRPEAIRP